MRERVKWIDTARFLGIVSIYIGHIGSTAGLVYPYVFQYHVPLFFFISGCMSVYDKERNMGKFLLKKVKRLLLPMWVFAVLSVVISIIQAGSGESLMDNLLLIAKGCVRNSFLAGSLWFLSCLFVTEVIFKLLSLLMNRWIVLAAAAVMHIISTVLMNPSPVLVPRWWYNVDSMFYYILYYAIGSVVYPSIEKLFLLNSRRKKSTVLDSCFSYRRGCGRYLLGEEYPFGGTAKSSLCEQLRTHDGCADSDLVQPGCCKAAGTYKMDAAYRTGNALLVRE